MFVEREGTRRRTTLAFETRILHSDDQLILGDVAPGVFDRAVNPRLVAEFLADNRHHLVVAVDQGQVIGFASGVHYIHPDKPSELWINEVGVAASHQGQGVGRALIRALLLHGERLGCREAWVLTDRSNHAAMRLFASSGGQEAPHDPAMFTFVLDPKSGGSKPAG
jgi:ribosomal protein S18 acetylase RimI-like enzyme